MKILFIGFPPASRFFASNFANDLDTRKGFDLEFVNYHHLLYFRTVAKEGSVTKASKVLRLAQPTISGQIRLLEQSLGERLFERQGRNLVLTPFGHKVYRYADEIFTLGQDMLEALKGQTTEKPGRLMAGAADHLPKLVVHRILSPLLTRAEPVELSCSEGLLPELLNLLGLHLLDMVISDTPVLSTGRLKVRNHEIGWSELAVFGTPQLVETFGTAFPGSLNGAPFLLPPAATSHREEIDAWFHANSIEPEVKAEIQDSALLKTFAQDGAGLAFAPSVLKDDLSRVYGLTMMNGVPGLEQRFYAVCAERKFEHPLLAAVLEEARRAWPNNRAEHSAA
jgi:LysR family transcriptional activator of nhaA